MKKSIINAKYVAKKLDPKAKQLADGSWILLCPTHNDTENSLSISDGHDGKLLVHCHAGCSQNQSIDYLKARSLWPGAASKEILYDYIDENGKLAYQFVRNEDYKYFRHKDESGQWVNNMGDKKIPFQLPQVRKAIANKEMIWVVEGEKDAVTLAKMGLVATTNPNGAGKWREDYTAELKGAAQVTIIPDEDKIGLEHAWSVAESCAKAGIPVMLIRLPGMTNGQDVSDWIELGGTKKALLELVSKTAPFQIPQSQTGDAPPKKIGEFELTKEGVFWIPDGKTKQFVCGYLEVVGESRDMENQNWGKLLSWKDPDGKDHSNTIPSTITPEELRTSLSSGGLSIANPHKLYGYLQACHPSQRIRCTDKVGWHGNVYVQPKQSIGQAPEEIVFQTSASEVSIFDSKGTLAEWRDNIAAVCVNNSRLVLVVCVAFAAVLLSLLSLESGGIHLKGKSSIGKTTLLILAASIWGNFKTFMRNWTSTVNGLEAITKAHNDCVLILDELAQCDPSQAGNSAYLLANGKGKQRASKTAEAKKSAMWTILFLSSGEVSLSDHMWSDGKKSKAGQEVRMVDVDAARIHGVFDNLHQFASGEQLAVKLKQDCGEYYGTAGVEFVKRLSQDMEPSLTKVNSTIQAFIKDNLPAGAAGQVHRVANRFALLAAAGELATEFGITGWSEGEAVKASSICFKDWIRERGGHEQLEETKILEQVRHYFGQYGDSKFTEWHAAGTSKTIIRAGFRRKTTEDQVEFYVLPESFKNEICKGFNAKDVIDVLLKHGILLPQKKEGTPQKAVRLPGIGKAQRCYHISSHIWSTEDFSPEEIYEPKEKNFHDGRATEKESNNAPVTAVTAEIPSEQVSLDDG